MEIVASRTIAAPAARVFGIVADIPNWPKVVKAVKTVSVLPGEPAGVGSHVRQTRKMFRRLAIKDMSVAALDAPHRLLLTADSRGVHYLAEYLVEDVDAASARLTLRFRATPETWLARLMARLTGLLGPGAKRSLDNDLNDFATAAEKTGAS
jgi:Polyketide cyclase / dehydrase and lipid transport